MGATRWLFPSCGPGHEPRIERLAVPYRNVSTSASVATLFGALTHVEPEHRSVLTEMKEGCHAETA